MFKFLVLLLLPMSALAMDLDLSYDASADNMYEAAFQGDSFQGSILLAEARESRMIKERRENRQNPKKPVVISRPNSDNSVLPAILGCGLLGLSLYGDSSAWKAGSAMACGFGLTYTFN